MTSAGKRRPKPRVIGDVLLTLERIISPPKAANSDFETQVIE